MPPLEPQNGVLLPLLLGILGGLALSTSTAVAVEFLSRRLRFEEEVERYLELPVLAVIPDLEAPPDLVPARDRRRARMSRIYDATEEARSRDDAPSEKADGQRQRPRQRQWERQRARERPRAAAASGSGCSATAAKTNGDLAMNFNPTPEIEEAYQQLGTNLLVVPGCRSPGPARSCSAWSRRDTAKGPRPPRRCSPRSSPGGAAVACAWSRRTSARRASSGSSAPTRVAASPISSEASARSPTSPSPRPFRTCSPSRPATRRAAPRRSSTRRAWWPPSSSFAPTSTS